ncbi:MAG: hypothetical protein BWY02_02974 [bacterium ADurb.Bin157]|nr:MAG: hypothetical protein BWY02_02974 [bacterium ADurb.Bin157]
MATAYIRYKVIVSGTLNSISAFPSKFVLRAPFQYATGLKSSLKSDSETTSPLPSPPPVKALVDMSLKRSWLIKETLKSPINTERGIVKLFNADKTGVAKPVNASIDSSATQTANSDSTAAPCAFCTLNCIFFI